MEPEPWMCGTHRELDALRRGVVHALELCGRDTERWAAGLDDDAMVARPGGLPSVSFHLRHLVRSLDRLLTYAEDQALSEPQWAALASEAEACTAVEVLQEFREGLQRAIDRVRRFRPEDYERPRGIGRQRLPTTVGGLLVHCADHSQRHAGQMVTTVKALSALRSEPPPSSDAPI